MEAVIANLKSKSYPVTSTKLNQLNNFVCGLTSADVSSISSTDFQ